MDTFALPLVGHEFKLGQNIDGVNMFKVNIPIKNKELEHRLHTTRTGFWDGYTRFSAEVSVEHFMKDDIKSLKAKAPSLVDWHAAVDYCDYDGYTISMEYSFLDGKDAVYCRMLG